MPKSELLHWPRLPLFLFFCKRLFGFATAITGITLPHDMAEVVERKIRSGAYASVSEVMRDGVRALIKRDAAIRTMAA
jgi:putative addiction module CopG family antidote